MNEVLPLFRFIQFIIGNVDPVLMGLLTAPEDDEPWTDEDGKASEEGWSEYRAGKAVSLEDFAQEMGYERQ